MATQIGRYREALLDPARVAPPTIPFEERQASSGPVIGTARPLLAEDAPWNQWEGGGPLLFNNRMAHLFEVRVEGPGPVRWLPADSRIELNDDETVVPAAASTETLLGELLYWGFLEERWALDGDLVARTRAAGPFRDAYLPAEGPRGELLGVLGFPMLASEEGVMLADKHVVALRLTLAVEAGGERHDLVWVFD